MCRGGTRRCHPRPPSAPLSRIGRSGRASSPLAAWARSDVRSGGGPARSRFRAGRPRRDEEGLGAGRRCTDGHDIVPHDHHVVGLEPHVSAGPRARAREARPWRSSSSRRRHSTTPAAAHSPPPASAFPQVPEHRGPRRVTPQGEGGRARAPSPNESWSAVTSRVANGPRCIVTARAWACGSRWRGSPVKARISPGPPSGSR